jgi:hypothetical protein
MLTRQNRKGNIEAFFPKVLPPPSFGEAIGVDLSLAFGGELG